MAKAKVKDVTLKTKPKDLQLVHKKSLSKAKVYSITANNVPELCVTDIKMKALSIKRLFC